MSDMSEAPRLWARKGEAICCINGHPVVNLARDVYVGEPRANDGSDFTDWQQPEPERALSVAEIRCSECRGVWIRGNTQDGYQFHFAEGWR